MARNLKYSRYLSRDVSEEKIPTVVIFVDTETEKDENSTCGEQDLILWGYEVWSVTATGQRGEMLDSGILYTPDDFHNLMKLYPDKRVVAHNWEWDAGALGIAWRTMQEEHGYTINMDKSIVPAERGMYNPFLLQLQYEDSIAELICNTNFWKDKLSEIGLSFGIEKKEMPTADQFESRGEFLEVLADYCQRDVEILRESWFSVFDFTQELAGVTPGITAAMACERVYRAGFLPDAIHNRDLEAQGTRHRRDITEAEQEAYKGGRTDTFWKGQAPAGTRVLKYDVNSMYPSVMKGEMPIRFRRSTTSNSKGWQAAKGKRDQFIYCCLVSLSIDPETALGWLGLEGFRWPSDDGEIKLVFPAGDFKVWLWQPLLEIAYREGWLADIHETISYNTGVLFDDYVDTLYARKREAKAAGEKSRERLFKLFLNGLYGKFGQREYVSWYEMTGGEYKVHFNPDMPEWDFKSLFERDAYGNRVETKLMRIGDRLWAYTPKEKGQPKPEAIISVAGYITAKGRAVLFEGMKGIIEAGGQVFMCDTDSIITDTPMPENMVHPTRLGAWDLEGESDAEGTNFQAPKHYTFNNVSRIKGVPLGTAQDEDGGYTMSVFPKMRTRMLSQNPDRRAAGQGKAIVTTMTKYPTGENTKRVENGDGKPTSPIHLTQEDY